MSALTNGLTGLMAAQAGVLTTSHNISNASTPGFSRQRIVQTTNLPLYTGSGFFGQGTSISNVQRMYDQYLIGRVYAAETRVGELDAYLSEITQIDNMLADPSSGLTPSLSEFFKGVQDVAANPSSIPARQAMLSAAQALTARFQAIDQNLYEQRQGVNQQITSEISLINTYTAQIANLNQQIIFAESAGSNQAPNDLYDQREHLLQELNKEIRVTTVKQSDGTVSVFIGNGQPVVMSTFAYPLVAEPANDDPEKITVGIQTLSGGGGTVQLQENLLNGGKLGGLLAFERESLSPAQNALGRIAVALATAFNQQHRLGQDLNGAMGIDLFRFPQDTSGTMFAYSNLHANKANVGTAVLSAQILQSDYRAVYNGVTGAYDIYRLHANLPMASASPAGTPLVIAPPLTPGGSVTIDGVTITAAAGVPSDGDAFTIKPGNPVSTRIVADSANSLAGSSALLSSTQAGIGALTGSDYRIDYTSSGYVVTRMTDNAIVPYVTNALPQDTITFDGVTIQLPTVPPVVGDSFMLQPTRSAARDITVNFNDPRLIAAGAPFRTRADLGNTGMANIDAGSMEVLDPNWMPLSGPVTLEYFADGNPAAVPANPTWEITWQTGLGPVTMQVQQDNNGKYAPGRQNVIDVNGIRFTISGSPQDGDKFYVETNSNGVSDNRNAQMLGALQTKRFIGGNSSTTSDAYAQIVSMIGNKTREVQVTLKAQETLANQANDEVSKLSGVNLDEEAANLIRYQQAYQASAKMIDVANKLFDEFLAAVR